MRNKIITVVVALACCIHASAQKDYDTPVRVFVPDGTVSADNQQYLKDRLQSMVVKQGMGSESYSTRFCLYPVLSEEDCIVSGSVPTMFTLKIDMSLYVADIFNGKVYATHTKSIRGVGKSKDSAYRNAISAISKNASAYDSFMAEIRDEIVAYYKSEGNSILRSAESCVAINDYEQAMFLLSSIPSSCDVLYEKAQSRLVDVYEKYLDYNGKVLLAKAKSVWAATQDRAGALEVMEIINGISPESDSFPDAEKFVVEVGKRIGEEWTLSKELIRGEQQLEKQRIDAARQVGVAYGNNQKPTTLVLDK